MKNKKKVNFIPKNFILDADGVFTDGKFYYTTEGKVMKQYGPEDADALSLLKGKVNIHVLSADKRGFPITKKRIADDMKLSLDNVSSFERLAWIKERFDLSETIYMGDGIYDPLVFREVAYSIAPANAFIKTKEFADFVTNAKGGEGAVAEAVLHILEKFFTPFDLFSHDFAQGSGAWEKQKKIIQYISREENVITRERTLKPLHTFENFPVYIGCTDKPQNEDILSDLSLAICKKTGVIQLDKVLPLEVVYPQYHSEALGGVWKDHHLQFVDFVNKYKPQKVLEIGGSNGFIALEGLKNKKIKKWVMVEPTPSIESKGRLEIIPTMFDQNFVYDKPIDMVVHSHTLEHIYEPADFMEAIGLFVKKDGLHVFSVPNLYKYLKNKYANWINFEHTIFLTEYYIDFLLAVNDFEIIEKKYYLEHSIFYATRKKQTKGKKKKITFVNKYKQNKKLFFDFLTFYKKQITDFNKKIKKFDGDVYLFGAHIFSQFLLHEGLDTSIKNILDNSKLKHGKRLYGTNMYVTSLESIKELPRVAVIVKAGAYQDEIKQQLKQLNKNVVIWE